MSASSFREAGAARAGGYVIALASVLIVIGLIFHPLPSGGFEEKPSILQNTPWWGPIHIAIAAGFVLCVVGGMLMMFGAGILTRRWTGALSWAAITVGMMFFSGVALINGWVMHYLSNHGAPKTEPLIYTNVPAFLWFGYYGLRIASLAAKQPN